jgi:hypothetical protein
MAFWSRRARRASAPDPLAYGSESYALDLSALRILPTLVKQVAADAEFFREL